MESHLPDRPHPHALEASPSLNGERGERLTGKTGRELLVLFLILLPIHLLLWWRSLPLAYQDLSFYFEPAILLARHGWLAGPGSHYHDLTYVRGMYFYPPGFFLILAGWIKVFGAAAGALLAYTHTVHLAYLLGLWVLVRDRLRCALLPSALAILSAFPLFGHGRADLTALLLGTLAWLALPARFHTGRLLLAAVCLGMAVLVSPPFGISSGAAVGVYYLASGTGPTRHRIGRFLLLTAAAITFFAGSWAAVLTWQDAWGYGVEQFTVNSQVRAAELNHFPAPSPYLIVFALVPLGFLTLLPVVAVLLVPAWRAQIRLRATALAYLGGFAIWFILSKAPLLTGAHHGYLARPVFHAALGSARGWLGRLGILAVLAFSVVHWYYQKDSLLALAQGYSGIEEQASRVQVPPGAIAALDSDVFPYLYRDGQSVTYELMPFDYWRRTRERTRPETLAALGLAECTSPVEPDLVVVSARTLMIFGPPDSTRFEPTSGAAPVVERATILGRSVRFPSRPEEVFVFRRRPGAPGADAGDPACRLLPAVRDWRPSGAAGPAPI